VGLVTMDAEFFLSSSIIGLNEEGKKKLSYVDSQTFDFNEYNPDFDEIKKINAEICDKKVYVESDSIYFEGNVKTVFSDSQGRSICIDMPFIFSDSVELGNSGELILEYIALKETSDRYVSIKVCVCALI